MNWRAIVFWILVVVGLIVLIYINTCVIAVGKKKRKLEAQIDEEMKKCQASPADHQADGQADDWADYQQTTAV